MPEAAKTAAAVYREFGSYDFLILCMCLALGFLIYKIAKTQDRIADKLNAISDNQQKHDARGGLIQQNQEHMHSTCKDHGERITKLHTGMIEFKEEITGEITELQTEVRVLKEKVS